MAITLTQQDEALLSLLKVNARTPVAVIARRLGVSRTTVQDRLRRLEEGGVIAGYRVTLGKDVDAARLRAVVMLEISPRAAAAVQQALAKRPEVEMLHSVSGKFDLVAFVAAASPEALNRLLDTIGEIEGVLRTDTSVVLSTRIDRR